MIGVRSQAPQLVFKQGTGARSIFVSLSDLIRQGGARCKALLNTSAQYLLCGGLTSLLPSLTPCNLQYYYGRIRVFLTAIMVINAYPRLRTATLSVPTSALKIRVLE